MHNQKSITTFVFTAGFITEAFFLVFIYFNGKAGNIPLYMFIYFETFLIMLVTLFLIKRLSKEEQVEENPSNTKKNDSILKFFAKILSFKKSDADKLGIPLFVIFFGLIFRLTLFPANVSTSNDVNRYLWEGKILSHGFNPYTTAPIDSQLVQFRDSVYKDVTYKNMVTIYPPVAQAAFLSAYKLIGENPAGLKIIYLLFDLMIMFLLLKFFYLKQIDLNNIILYAWMPLILLEYFVNAHVDLIGIFFMLLFLYLMEKGRVYFASIPFAIAFLAKMYPVVLFPLIIKKAGLKRSFYFLLIFLAITVCGYAPFIYKDFSVFTSLFTYLKNWEFNSSVYHILKHNYLSPENSRIICGALFIISSGLVSYFYKDFTKAAYTIFIMLIIFGTTLYPWYLGWIASINPMFNFYSVTSLLFTINFSNFSPLGAVWKEYLFAQMIEYVPFFALLVIDVWIIWKKKKVTEKQKP